MGKIYKLVHEPPREHVRVFLKSEGLPPTEDNIERVIEEICKLAAEYNP